MTIAWRLRAGLAGLALLGFVLGCNRTKEPTQSPVPRGPMGGPIIPPGFDAESGPHAAGKKVFVTHGCFRCHAIAGVGGPPAGGPPMAGVPGGPGGPPGPGGPGGPEMMMPNKGPDLGHVGGDPEHTLEWLMEHVRKPKSHKPNSRMPPYEGKIPDDDLRALAEYLASLK